MEYCLGSASDLLEGELSQSQRGNVVPALQVCLFFFPVLRHQW